MSRSNHHIIIQSFKWVSLHGLEFFAGFVRQIKASRDIELPESVLKHSFNPIQTWLFFDLLEQGVWGGGGGKAPEAPPI